MNAPPAPPTAPAPRNATAMLLNFFLPGVGHAYGGFVGRGLCWAFGGLGLGYAWAAVGSVVGPAIGYRPWLIGFAALLVLSRVAPMVDYRFLRPTGGRRWGLACALAAGLVACTFVGNVALRALFIEAFKIPASSMFPTLVDGDHLFVTKTSGLPHRGDLQVFRYPENPEVSYVKRILGVPGDRLEFHESRPIINGWTVPRCLVGPASYRNAFEGTVVHEGDVYLEYLEGKAYLTFYDREFLAGHEQGPWTVPPNGFFAIGDNRNNSHDSRMWFAGVGASVPEENLQGRPFTIWLSSPSDGIDYSRLGVGLDAPRLPGALADPALQARLEICLTAAPRKEDTIPPPP